MEGKCPLKKCPGAKRGALCGYWPNGLTCHHPKYRVEWEQALGAALLCALLHILRESAHEREAQAGKHLARYEGLDSPEGAKHLEDTGIV